MAGGSDALTVTNGRTGAVLGRRVRAARNPVARLRGLLGHGTLGEGEGLLLEPCNGVHMFFMRYALDVAFLDRQWRVVEVRRGLRPWHAVPRVRGAHAALELRAGALAATEAGDVLRIEPTVLAMEAAA